MIVLIFISIISSLINAQTSGKLSVSFDTGLTGLCSINNLESFTQYKSLSFFQSESDHNVTTSIATNTQPSSLSIFKKSISSKEEGVNGDYNKNIFTRNVLNGSNHYLKFNGSNGSICAEGLYKYMDDVFTISINNYYIIYCMIFMQILSIFIVAIRYLQSQNSPPFLYIIMCSWIILICNGGPSTCAQCDDLNPQTQIVWGTSTVTTYDISSYTLGQIKYITAGAGGATLSCESDSTSIEFGRSSSTIAIRVLFGGGPVGEDKCCDSSNPRGICNLPNKQNDLNELCRNLGYSSSFTTQMPGTDCPAASFSNEKWTSDFVQSNFITKHFYCAGCGVPDPPLSDAPTTASTQPTSASNTPTQIPSLTTISPTQIPSFATIYPTQNPSLTTIYPTQNPSLTTIYPTQNPSLTTIYPTQNLSLTTIYPTQSPSRDSSELSYSKENAQSSETQSHIEDSLKNVKKSTPQNKNQRSSDQSSDRNLLAVNVNHNPTHTKEYSESIVPETESLQQVEMLQFTQQQLNEYKSAFTPASQAIIKATKGPNEQVLSETKIIYEMVIGSIILITIFIYYTYTQRKEKKDKDNDYEPLINDNV